MVTQTEVRENDNQPDVNNEGNNVEGERNLSSSATKLS